MKRLFNISVITLISIVLFSSCEDKRYKTFMANVPKYISYEDLRKTVTAEDSRDIIQPGKIYFKDQYIYINEYMSGVHVIDISDPSSPDPVTFIPVPGNVDMAIKDNTLYLDSYTDLVLIDISDPTSPSEERRMEGLLEYTLPEYDYEYPLAEIDEDEGVVIDFEIKEYTQEIYSTPNPYPIFWNYTDMLSSSVSSVSSVPSAGASYGIAGSMARFLTYDNYLYLLENQYNLKVIDIASKDTPLVVQDKYVGWGLETMFIYDDYLYLGAMDGMYIMSLEAPDQPYTTSVYRHITSCDPVVVSGNTAYVTLRSGNRCGAAADLLEVIDISDKYNPTRIATYPMDQPYGLGISGSTLFVCEDESGLSVYDASDPNSITDHQLAEFSDIQATDVIPIDTLLFTIGDGGFYIYDYSDLNDISQIGSILVSAED